MLNCRTPALKSLLYLSSCLVGILVLYFLRLGAFPLLDPDEPVYGQVAKEMARGAGWLTPHYNGALWFDKPPLFYWLSALSTLSFGPTELAARLPSALLAVGLLALVYALATYDAGRRAGLMSAVVMATCLQQIVLARAAVTDMTLAFCLTAALYGYRRWLDAEGKGRWRWAITCGGMTGLAMLAKGPVAPVLLGATIFIHLWWTKRLRRLWSGDALAAVVIWGLVGLTWFVAMFVLHRQAFVQGFLIVNNLVRFLKPEHPGQTGHWYATFFNIPVLLVFFFPWSVFLPQAVTRLRRTNDGACLALVWCAVVFVFFSLSRTKLVTYIFPLYPAAALFVGFLWYEASNNAKAARSVFYGLCFGLGVALLITLTLWAICRRDYPVAESAALILGGILVVSSALALMFMALPRHIHWSYAFWTLGGGMALFTLWLLFRVMPLAAPLESTKALARQIRHLPSAQVSTFGIRSPSLLYYLDYEPEEISNIEEARRLVQGSKPVVIICPISKANSLVSGRGTIVRNGPLALVTNLPMDRLKGP